MSHTCRFVSKLFSFPGVPGAVAYALQSFQEPLQKPPVRSGNKISRARGEIDQVLMERQVMDHISFRILSMTNDTSPSVIEENKGRLRHRE